MVDKKEDLAKFSKWLRAQLLEVGMTARDLSIASGVDESEVSKMTRGVRWPSLRTIKSVAPHLKCSGQDFLAACGLDKDFGR